MKNNLCNRFSVYWVVVLLVLAMAPPAFSQTYKPDPGAFSVEIFLLDLQDEDRDRAVPIKVYMPRDAVGPRPIVIVSHGLGGSRDGLSYLGNHWASHGYLCVHMQHPGSDRSVWEGLARRDILSAMKKAAQDPMNAINRAGDTTFVLNEIEKLSKDAESRIHGKVDLAKAGIAGHSFGAWTAMAAGGMTLGGAQATQLGERRIRCMIPLSPPVAKDKRRYDQIYGSLSIPSLFMTGTLDTSVISPSTTAADRQIPYDKMHGVSKKGWPKYQINFDGADHMTFSGETGRSKRLRKADPKTDPIFHSLILQSTTAFLDAYLLKDKDAKAWLNDGGFVKAVGKHGEVSMDVK